MTQVSEEVSKYMSEIAKKGWKDVPKEKRFDIMSKRGKNGGKNKWAKMTTKQRLAFALMLQKSRYDKPKGESNPVS